MDQNTYTNEYQKERQRVPVTEYGEVTPSSGPSPAERRGLAELAAGGSTASALTGVGAGVLAIIGLAGFLPFYMTTIATIALGAGLFMEGTALGAGLGKLDRHGVMEEEIAAGGFTLQALAGAAGIVLGILSLIGLLPGVLVPVSLITMGGALAFGGPARAELNLTALEVGGASVASKRVAIQGVYTSAGLLTLVGLGTITLGILALLKVPQSPVLMLVGLLALGGTVFLCDSVLLGTAGSTWKRLRARTRR